MCNRPKKHQNKPKAHQVQYHAGSPLERIHIDVLGPLIETPRGNQYVLVVVDQFLLEPWCLLGDLDALSSCTVIRVLHHHVVTFSSSNFAILPS